MHISIKSFIVVLMLTLVCSVVISDILQADEKLPAGALKIMDNSRYKHSRWGILVKDLETGQVLYEHNANELFVPASTTKVFTIATAFDSFGADYRFKTPVYRIGEIDKSGTLNGDLILVASGDLTMGGRTLPNGEIAYVYVDHTGAGNDGEFEARLTEPDPLAGIDKLAREVASSGIKRIKGDVIIDDRLFEAHVSATGIMRTSVVINDNFIDFAISPTEAGKRALVEWRPKTMAYQIDAQVYTTEPDKEPEIEISSPSSSRIVIRGEVPENYPYQPVVRVYQVEDPVSFARSLFIEALERARVTVSASPLEKNPSDKLPNKDAYGESNMVALLESPPYKETARLILKVSHNLGADITPLLVAVNNGKKMYEEGLLIERDFLQKMGVDVSSISISDGAGGDPGDFITPAAAVQLLSSVYKSDYFEAYHRALPILGVDGTLAHSVGAASPVRGKVYAKTGTLITGNIMNNRPILVSKGLAGYMTTSNGQNLVFAIYVNNVPMEIVDDMGQIGSDLGSICESIYTVK